MDPLLPPRTVQNTVIAIELAKIFALVGIYEPDRAKRLLEIHSLDQIAGIIGVPSSTPVLETRKLLEIRYAKLKG